MTIYFSLMLMILLSFLFLHSFHPLSFILIIILQTLLTCFLTGTFLPSYWFSYVLFLIFLGGLLILFIYMASLAANELFTFSSSKMNLTLMLIFTFIIMSLFMLFNYSNINFDLLNNFLPMDYELSALIMFSNSFLLSAILMISFLLITLVAVVKVSQHQFGPLRQMF